MNLQTKIDYSIALLRKCEKMALDLDPATSQEAYLLNRFAEHFYTKEGNGLEKPWFGLVPGLCIGSGRFYPLSPEANKLSTSGRNARRKTGCRLCLNCLWEREYRGACEQ